MTVDVAELVHLHPRRACVDDFLDERTALCHVIGQEQIHRTHLEQLVHGVAGDPREGRVDLEPPARQVGDHDPDRGVVECRMEALLRLSQSLGGGVPVGDVPPGQGQPVADPRSPDVVVELGAAKKLVGVDDVVQHQGLTGLDDVPVGLQQARTSCVAGHQVEQPRPDKVLVVQAEVTAGGQVRVAVHEVHDLAGLVVDRFQPDVRVQQRVHGRAQLGPARLGTLPCTHEVVDVPQPRHDACRVTGFAHHRGGPTRHPPVAPGPRPHPHHEFVGGGRALATGEGPRPLGSDPFLVVGMDQIGQPGAHQVRLCPSQRAGHRGRHPRDPMVGAGQHDDVRRVLGQQLVLPAGRSQRRLRLPLPGDVSRRDQDPVTEPGGGEVEGTLHAVLLEPRHVECHARPRVDHSDVGVEDAQLPDRREQLELSMPKNCLDR